MFGTLGFSELIIILVIVLIIFGAGRLPQIGEGVGKALKGFKKEVHEDPAPPQTAAVTGTPIEDAQVMRAPQQAPPPLPPTAQAMSAVTRPSAVGNQDAVARVQAQQAALPHKSTQADEAVGPTGQDMQNLGEGLGDTLRSFRRAVADVRSSIDPEVRTIRAEMDAAQKEIEQSVELAKLGPMTQETPPAKSSLG